MPVVHHVLGDLMSSEGVGMCRTPTLCSANQPPPLSATCAHNVDSFFTLSSCSFSLSLLSLSLSFPYLSLFLSSQGPGHGMPPHMGPPHPGMNMVPPGFGPNGPPFHRHPHPSMPPYRGRGPPGMPYPPYGVSLPS